MSWYNIDCQMQEYRDELKKIVKIDLLDADCLATKISSEIRFIERDQKEKLRQATPVELCHRLDELKAIKVLWT